MKLLLAPMEGVLDGLLRELLTRVGGIDHCVSEFIRVTDSLLPERVFLRRVSELQRGGRTAFGVPVRPQLLGSDPQCLADNAARLAALGAPGVDLNFGCPSKVVNRHRGGAALLDEPELLFRIVAAVRRTVPHHLPVSAKMRLGLKHDGLALACASAIEAGGASELVVHARTQAQGYRPPAHWRRISDILAVVKLPVIANGDIWCVQDALACQQASGCRSLMLGRGMLANPRLALDIRAALTLDLPACTAPDWPQTLALLHDFWALATQQLPVSQQVGRLKQWLRMLQRSHPQAGEAFEAVRALRQPREVDQWLGQQRSG